MFQNIFTYKFWFVINRVMLEGADRLFLITAIAAGVLALLLRLGYMLANSPVEKKYWKMFSGSFFFLAVWELVWYGARTQNVRFFGTRFVAGLGLAVFLYAFFKALYKRLKYFSAEKAEWDRVRQKEKYLPR